MTPVWSLPGRDEAERRYDGPIPSPDSPTLRAAAALGRARLFQRLVERQRQDGAAIRSGMPASQAPGDERLGRCQRALRSYRDQGAAWMPGRRE